MAKTVTWMNDDHELCVLTITDGSSENVALTPADSPFMTATQESDDLFTPIRTSSGYIRIIVDTVNDIASLVGSYPLARPVSLTTSKADGTSPTEKWRGFLSCENFSQTWDKGPIEIELPVSSPLDVLHGIYPPVVLNKLGYINFAQFLLNANTALGNPFTYFYFPVLSTAATTLQYQFTMQNYATAIDKNTTHEVASYYDILEDICKLFGWQCIEYGTSLVFLAADVKHLEEGYSNNYQGYTTQKLSEIANGGTSVVISDRPSFSAVYPTIYGADHTQSWLAGKKSVEVTGSLNERDETIWSMDILEQCSYKGSDRYVPGETHYYIKKYGAYKSEDSYVVNGNIQAFNTKYADGEDADVEGYNIKFENFKSASGTYMGGSVGYERLYVTNLHRFVSGDSDWMKRLILRHDGNTETPDFQAFIISTNFLCTQTQNHYYDVIKIGGQLLYAARNEDGFAKQGGARYTKAAIRVVSESGTYYWTPSRPAGWYLNYAEFLMEIIDGEITYFGGASGQGYTFYDSIPIPPYSGELQLILIASTAAGGQNWPGTAYIAYENLSIKIIPVEVGRGSITIEEKEQRADENQKKVDMFNGFSDSWNQDCGLTLAREDVPDSYGVVLKANKALPTSLYNDQWPEDAMASRAASYFRQARQKLKVIVKQGENEMYKGAMLSPFRAYHFDSIVQNYICVEQQMNWRTNEITAGFFEPSFTN